MAKGSNKQKQSSSEPDELKGSAAHESNEPTATGATSHIAPSAARSSQGTSAPDSGRLPQTCCSNCQTVFEVSPELLASNDTRVRCGECLSIFDALINLRSEEIPDSDDFLVDAEGNFPESDGTYAGALAGASDDFTITGDYSNTSGLSMADTSSQEPEYDPSILDLTHSDYDLFSGEAGLPEVAYFDQTQDVENLRFDEPDGDETFGDELFAHDLTLNSTGKMPFSDPESSALEDSALDADVDYVTDDVSRDPLVFNYRDPDDESAKYPEDGQVETRQAESAQSAIPVNPEGSKASRPRSWLINVMLALLVLLIAAGLYAHRNRQALVQNPDLRPFLSNACALFRCQLPPLVSLDELKVVKRTVFSHPTLENALVINLAFINQASFAQAYPVLEIRLTDRNGGLVVQRNVDPAHYLDDWQYGDALLAGQRLDLSLTVEDPGQTASSFELKFR